ncbi:MAG TPA: DNA repair protein RecN [candidate division Zixibacteria bacterium]|nr:DNA repair protein RecN [candidate division Zixibacteria bacterium]
MIVELYIRNFAIIEEVRIDFQTGFNVLTGETGAGKSIILDAMALVLGERADTGVIREGSSNAYVEAIFRLDWSHPAEIQQFLVEQELEGDEKDLLLLSRELRSNGRSVCRVNGRTVNLALIRTLGDSLVDIHGQGDHLSLLRPKSHLPLLDAYASLEGERKDFQASVRQLREIRQNLADLRHDERTLTRRQELLTYQIQEIDAADLSPGEEEELRAEQIQLANVEQLLIHGSQAMKLLDAADSDSLSAIDLLGQAEQSLGRLAILDERQRALYEKYQDLNYQLSDLTAELASYCEQLEHSPNRLDHVEERLELIGNLKRKYGGSIEAILTKQEEANVELEQIANSEFRIHDLATEEEKLLRHIGETGQQLSMKRQGVAVQLGDEVERELADLNMQQARFAVAFSRSADEDGVYVGDERFAFDETGIDWLEFQVSTNPGEPLRPLAKVASGGETSRLMLALKSVLARVDGTPTLIFDEIDQGIGGRVGDVVGQKLWRISITSGHQIIIVTHLPQLAGYAEGHYRVSKKTVADRTLTSVKPLDKEGRVEELAEMLGTMGEYAIGGAESILRRVAEVKNGV